MSTVRIVVPERGTRLRLRKVESDGNGYLWTRRPGPEAPHPFVDPPPPVALAVRAVTTVNGSRWVLGEQRSRARVYRVRGNRSIADELLEASGEDARALIPPVRELGALLRSLHALSGPGLLDGLAPFPPTSERLRRWFTATGPCERLDRTRAVLRGRLGHRRWNTLKEWAFRPCDAGELVAGHGWPGLGRSVAHRPSGTVEGLIGEEMALVPAPFDVGLLVGELLELHKLLGSPRLPWADLLEALMEGYGRRLDAPVLRYAALGLLLHLHDYCVYTEGGLRGAAEPRADLAAGLLDRAG